jgi:hypothetical protein
VMSSGLLNDSPDFDTAAVPIFVRSRCVLGREH